MSEKKEERILDRITSLKILEKKGPIRQFFNTQELTKENLTDEQRQLARSFREGMAQALGVPTEYIMEERVQKWIINFTQAFIKPEHIKETIAPSPRLMKIRGQELGTIIREGIEKIKVEQENVPLPPKPIPDLQQPEQQPRRVQQSLIPVDQ